MTLWPTALGPKGLATIEDLAISNMWEVAALVEVLERKGVLTLQELYAAINDLRHRPPDVTTLESPCQLRFSFLDTPSRTAYALAPLPWRVQWSSTVEISFCDQA